MRISLRCTGGFAGPAGAQTRTVDLDSLPEARAEQLRQLVQASSFFTLPPQLVKPQPKSWDFRYALQVENDGQSHSVSYYLDAAPAPLRELTEKLNEVDPD